MHPRAVNAAFAKAFNLLGKMGPRELRDKMEEMGYKPGTGLFKELLKSRGKSNFKDGGLAMAIKKVQAKEMQLGGDVPKPKMRPKKDPFRADKTKPLNEEFSKKVAKTNEKNMKNVKKDAVPPKYKGFSKLPEKVQQKIDEDLAAKYKMGGKVEEYGAGGNVGKGGKMACRGMGAAIKGGGFTIR